MQEITDIHTISRHCFCLHLRYASSANIISYTDCTGQTGCPTQVLAAATGSLSKGGTYTWSTNDTVHSNRAYSIRINLDDSKYGISYTDCTGQTGCPTQVLAAATGSLSKGGTYTWSTNDTVHSYRAYNIRINLDDSKYGISYTDCTVQTVCHTQVLAAATGSLSKGGTYMWSTNDTVHSNRAYSIRINLDDSKYVISYMDCRGQTGCPTQVLAAATGSLSKGGTYTWSTNDTVHSNRAYSIRINLDDSKYVSYMDYAGQRGVPTKYLLLPPARSLKAEPIRGQLMTRFTVHVIGHITSEST